MSQASLDVEWAATVDAIQGVKPKSASAKFAVVRVGISNDTSDSIPTGAVQFRVATSDGLEIASTPTSSLLADPCTDGVSVASGAVHTCEVAFEVDASAKATELLYDSGVGVKVQAAFTIDDPAQMCSAYCGNLAVRAGALKCAPFDTSVCTSDCEGTLKTGLGNGCVAEVQAINVCVLGLPDSAFSCPPGIELSVPGDCGSKKVALECFH